MGVTPPLPGVFKPPADSGRFYTRGLIIRLDELFSVVRRSRQTTEDSSSRRIIRLVPVFILETNKQMNNKYLPKFVQTNNASSSITRCPPNGIYTESLM